MSIAVGVGVAVRVAVAARVAGAVGAAGTPVAVRPVGAIGDWVVAAVGLAVVVGAAGRRAPVGAAAVARVPAAVRPELAAVVVAVALIAAVVVAIVVARRVHFVAGGAHFGVAARTLAPFSARLSRGHNHQADYHRAQACREGSHRLFLAAEQHLGFCLFLPRPPRGLTLSCSGKGRLCDKKRWIVLKT